MNTRGREFKRTVYDVMTGVLCKKAEHVEDEPQTLTSAEREEAEIIESLQKNIVNEYDENSLCEKKYEEIFKANQKLCERLGVVEEDDDVECIINNFFDITKHLCLKMYDYGALFGMYEDTSALMNESLIRKSKNYT